MQGKNGSTNVHDDVCKKIMFLLDFSLITYFYLRTINFLLSLKTLYFIVWNWILDVYYKRHVLYRAVQAVLTITYIKTHYKFTGRCP